MINDHRPVPNTIHVSSQRVSIVYFMPDVWDFYPIAIRVKNVVLKAVVDERTKTIDSVPVEGDFA